MFLFSQGRIANITVTNVAATLVVMVASALTSMDAMNACVWKDGQVVTRY